MSEKYDSDFTYSSKSSHKDPDLKNQLLKLLKEKGVVDKLKTQVRHNLISEVAAKESILNMKVRDKTSKDIDIFYHTCVSIFYEFLNKEDFQYTKSVFIPETGIAIDKFYSINEILRILQFDMNSEFCKKLKNSIQNCNKNFLVCLLKTISEFNNSTSINNENQISIPLSEKLTKLDIQFEDRQKQGVLKTQQLYEDRIISFQRDIEKRLRQEMENEIQRFKDHEISTMKLKEEDLFNKLFKEKSRLLEEEYQNRLNALKNRENVSQEHFQRFKESQDRENYLQRQQLLRDINNIQERELQIKKEREQMGREFDMMKEQHKLKINQLEERDSKLKELERGIDFQINQEVNSIKIDQEKRLLHKWKEVELMEMKLTEEKRNLEMEKSNIEKIKEELIKRQDLFNEMEIINYPILKQQNTSMQNQIEELKQQLQQQNLINQQDKHKIDCLLKQKMGPNFEQSVLKNELERARDIFNREKMIVEEQKLALEKRLLEEIKNKRVISDQYSQQQDLVEILTRQLSEKRDGICKNRMPGYLSNRSQNYVSNSARNISTNRDLSPHATTDRSRKFSNAFEFDNQDMDECCLPMDIEELANDAKHKLMTLDEETEQINKAYHEFKNRLANSFSALGELQPTSNLNFDIFKNGLEEGRMLKDKKDMFNEYHTQAFYSTASPNDEIEGNESKNGYSPQNNPISQSLNKMELKFNKSSDNLTNIFSTEPKVDSLEHRSSRIVKTLHFDDDQSPISHINKIDNYNEPIPTNMESETNVSEIINLDNKWERSKNNSKVNISLEDTERDIIHKSPANMHSDEDADIDPVVKKYMELVKKQKEESPNKSLNKDSNQSKKVADIHPVNEDEESETIKTESGNSEDLLSNKNNGSNHSESESFW